jgi:hypothetical protein
LPFRADLDGKRLEFNRGGGEIWFAQNGSLSCRRGLVEKV